MDFYYASPNHSKDYLEVPIDEDINWIKNAIEIKYKKPINLYLDSKICDDELISDIDMNNLVVIYITRCNICLTAEDAILNNHLDCLRCTIVNICTYKDDCDCDSNCDCRRPCRCNDCISLSFGTYSCIFEGCPYYFRNCDCLSDNDKGRLAVCCIQSGNIEILEYVCKNINGHLDIKLTYLLTNDVDDLVLFNCLLLALDYGLTFNDKSFIKYLLGDEYHSIICYLTSKGIFDSTLVAVTSIRVCEYRFCDYIVKKYGDTINKEKVNDSYDELVNSYFDPDY